MDHPPTVVHLEHDGKVLLVDAHGNGPMAAERGRHWPISLGINEQHLSVVLEMNHNGRVVHDVPVHPHRDERCGRSSATFLDGTEG